MRFSAKQKSRLLSNPLGSAWSDGGLHSAGGLTERVSDYHWYLSAHRAPDLPCSTASSMESITVAYLSWKSMLKRKELLLADSTIETGIEKTAGRKKGNLTSGLLVVVSAVLSLYVVQYSGSGSGTELQHSGAGVVLEGGE